jgi:NAD(P)-dependent dehydrogenase (short-subunit alcohol dehydrogenase family)
MRPVLAVTGAGRGIGAAVARLAAARGHDLLLTWGHDRAAAEATAAACREAARRMARSRGGAGGAIVCIGSRAAHYGSAFEFVHYAASKGAVDSMVRGLARELAGEGIRENAVAPGMIDTDIHASAGIPERIGRIVPLVPMQRLGTPEEVAEAVLWLLSDAASYVTGAVLDVGGGR